LFLSPFSILLFPQKMTLQEALQGSPAPQAIKDSQALIDLEHYNFEGKLCTGYLVAHRDLEAEIRAIFGEIFACRFPIFQMRPISEFDWSDDLSMEQNNCSAFNYRLKVGKSSLSAHATGRAIDINPCQNPYQRGELILPPKGSYNLLAPGTILDVSPVVYAFESRGWIWGGRWESLKDFHHFEKDVESE
jgi:peptidoglycan L-alanyl-D-glutamate endopeptidase CwlK